MKPSLLNWSVLSTDYQIVLVWQSRALTLAANGWQNICITDCECRKQITKNKANIYVFAKCLLTHPAKIHDVDKMLMLCHICRFGIVDKLRNSLYQQTVSINTVTRTVQMSRRQRVTIWSQQGPLTARPLSKCPPGDLQQQPRTVNCHPSKCPWWLTQTFWQSWSQTR